MSIEAVEDCLIFLPLGFALHPARVAAHPVEHVTGGTNQNGLGCGSNETAVHPGSQRRRIRRGGAPSAGQPYPSGTHSLHPSRIPWVDHSGARDESSGRSDDSSRGNGERGPSRRGLSPSSLRPLPMFTEDHRDGRRSPSTRARAETACTSTRCDIGSKGCWGPT